MALPPRRRLRSLLPVISTISGSILFLFALYSFLVPTPMDSDQFHRTHSLSIGTKDEIRIRDSIFHIPIVIFGVPEILDSFMDAVMPAASLQVRLHIKEVPLSVASKLCLLARTIPIVSCGLLQHESKMSVLHLSIKKHDSYDAPIKSEEELIFHVGFRQFLARHKMERFLHTGRFSMASIYAPISFPSLPLIALKASGEASIPVVAAVGSLKNIDPDRIILKKIILIGYPQQVSKLKASLRYMFHNPEDVRWFKPVQVWTKCGCRGRIKEPIGIHGIMKCVLNGVIQQHDTVCLSLHKRAYPKWPEHRFPLDA